MSDQQQVPVRLDRSRVFSTVHGERAPDDRHAAVQFYQEGLPYDAEGFLIFDHADFEPGKSDEEVSKAVRAKRALALKKSEKAAKTYKPPTNIETDGVEADEEDVDETDDDAGPSIDDVNLTEWLMGKEYVWHLVTQAIAGRYKKRVSNQADAVEFLVLEQRIVPRDQVCPKLKKLLPLD